MFKSVIAGMLFVVLSVFATEVSARQEQKPVQNSTQAAQQAKRHVEGRVLKVDSKKSAYRVKMLKKSGRVVSVDVDKRSGKVKTIKSKDGN